MGAKELLPSTSTIALSMLPPTLWLMRKVVSDYSGFAQAALPHRRPKEDAVWRVLTEHVLLLVEPGRRPIRDAVPIDLWVTMIELNALAAAPAGAKARTTDTSDRPRVRLYSAARLRMPRPKDRVS
jgi:hypothetical protein